MSKVLPITILTALCLILSGAAPLRGDTFGSGANSFIIDFVTVGNAGNANDSPAGGGAYYSPYGAVAYHYRIAATAVPRDWITKATAHGLINVTAAPWTGNKPACGVTWFEAAAFVNWLNTSTGNQPAYNLTPSGAYWSMSPWPAAEAADTDPGPGVSLNLYRHKNAKYFLPSENEWYKAAYHKNNGVTGNYWDYATGSDSPPMAVSGGTANGTAVFNSVTTSPVDVDNAGGLSAYGTRGQTGNVYEWTESDFDGVNDVPFEDRALRGGGIQDSAEFLRSSYRNRSASPVSDPFIGFRVAALADTDGDGIPDQFETGTGNYVSRFNTGSSPTNPDSDGDGFDDGFEVSLGFDPTSALSTPEIQASIAPATSTSVQYRFNAAKATSYRIEASPDLADWTTIENNITGAGGPITRFYSTAGVPKRFFRSRRN